MTMTAPARAPAPTTSRLAAAADPPRLLEHPDPGLPVQDVLRQLADFTTACGPVLSVQITEAIRSVQVHAADALAFTQWCQRLSTGPASFGEHEVGGRYVTAATVSEGWTVQVWLYGTAVEDLL